MPASAQLLIRASVLHQNMAVKVKRGAGMLEEGNLSDLPKSSGRKGPCCRRAGRITHPDTWPSSDSRWGGVQPAQGGSQHLLRSPVPVPNSAVCCSLPVASAAHSSHSALSETRDEAIILATRSLRHTRARCFPSVVENQWEVVSIVDA